MGAFGKRICKFLIISKNYCGLCLDRKIGGLT
jgi:hypothetical protein